MTWPEILTYLKDGGDAVIFPLGATEQHGPHLGTGMDTCLAEKLCAVVAEQTGVPALPTLAYGCSGGHSQRWPGTMALQPTTFITVLTELGDWLYAAGIRRIFFINCHVGNASPLHCAVDTLRCRYDDLMMADLSDGTLNEEIAEAFAEDGADWHANAAETSLMQALAPEMVREDQIVQSDDPDRTAELVFKHPVNRTSINGVTGSPSRASAGAGHKLFEKLVKVLVTRVSQGLNETPPLNEGYFNRIDSSKQ